MVLQVLLDSSCPGRSQSASSSIEFDRRTRGTLGGGGGGRGGGAGGERGERSDSGLSLATHAVNHAQQVREPQTGGCLSVGVGGVAGADAAAAAAGADAGAGAGVVGCFLSYMLVVSMLLLLFVSLLLLFRSQGGGLAAAAAAAAAVVVTGVVAVVVDTAVADVLLRGPASPCYEWAVVLHSTPGRVSIEWEKMRQVHRCVLAGKGVGRRKASASTSTSTHVGDDNGYFHVVAPSSSTTQPPPPIKRNRDPTSTPRSIGQ